MRRVLLATLLLAAACGTDAPRERTLSCPADEAEIIDALGSGLPTYDYDPATDLDALVERIDLAVSGTLVAVERIDDATVFRLASARTLAGDAAEFDGTFSTATVWVVRGETDPLGALVTLDGVSAIAFLVRDDRVPGGFTLDVQGLHVTCDANGGRLRSVIEPLPGDAQGATLRTLVATLDAA